MSLMGHSRPMHSVSVPINVRCYSNSDIIVRRSEVTLRANRVVSHRRKQRAFLQITTHTVRLDVGHQASPVGTIAAVSTIKITLLSGARVQCNTPFGTVKP
jgi:hypothetical protein